MDHENVGMVQGSGGTRFLVETLESFRIADNSRRENFNRDIESSHCCLGQHTG